MPLRNSCCDQYAEPALDDRGGTLSYAPSLNTHLEGANTRATPRNKQEAEEQEKHLAFNFSTDDSKPEIMHSFSPVPKTMASYVSSMFGDERTSSWKEAGSSDSRVVKG